MNKITIPFIITAILFPGLISCLSAQDGQKERFLSEAPVQLHGSGLMGYISSKAPQPSSGYGAGIGFYVAVYPILPEPIDQFQIGLASTWIVPKNADNTTILMDVGLNKNKEHPSPLLHNINSLNVSVSDIDHIFISHLGHRVHIRCLLAC